MNTDHKKRFIRLYVENNLSEDFNKEFFTKIIILESIGNEINLTTNSDWRDVHKEKVSLEILYINDGYISENRKQTPLESWLTNQLYFNTIEIISINGLKDKNDVLKSRIDDLEKIIKSANEENTSRITTKNNSANQLASGRLIVDTKTKVKTKEPFISTENIIRLVINDSKNPFKLTKLWELVSQGKDEEALELMLNEFGEWKKREIVCLMGDLNTIKREFLFGIIPLESKRAFENRIRISIIGLIEEIENKEKI